jgi:hypothetical protein
MMPPAGNFIFLTGTGYADNEIPLDAGLALGKTSFALLEELKNWGKNGEIWVLEVDLPGLTFRGCLNHAYDSKENGQYAGVILSMDSMDQRGPSVGGDMGARQPVVRVNDFSRTISKVWNGPNRQKIPGSPCRIKVAARQVRPEGWRTEFVGEVAYISWSSDLICDIVMRTSDATMRRKCPSGYLTRTKAEFPNIHISTEGTYAPLIYGRHNSQNYTNQGLIPLALVDTVDHIWNQSFAWTGIQRIYVDGVIADPGDWAILRDVRQGKLFTNMIWIDPGTLPDEDAVITSDATGYDNLGAGEGILLEYSAEVIMHILVNFIFHQSNGQGRWFSATAVDEMIDAILYEEFLQYCVDHGYRAAKHLAIPVEGYDLCREAGASTYSKMFWTCQGKVGFKLENSSELELQGRPAIRHGTDFKITPDNTVVTRSLTLNFAKRATDDKFLQFKQITDPDATGEDLQSETMNLDQTQVS